MREIIFRGKRLNDGECIAHEIKTDKTEFCSIGCKSKRKDVEELMNDKL